MHGPSSDDIDELTGRVIGCAIEVHRELGPGLLESVYRECLLIEIRARGISVEQDRRVALEYKGQRLRADLMIDLLVEGRLVLELKAVEHIIPVHLAQVITYLKLTGCPAGLLMNFHTTSLRSGLRRLVHPDLYVRAKLPRDLDEEIKNS